MGGKQLISQLYSLLLKRITLPYLLALVFIYRNELAPALHSLRNALRWILPPFIAVLGFCAVFAFTLLFGLIVRGFRRNYDEMEAEQREAWKRYIDSANKELRLHDERPVDQQTPRRLGILDLGESSRHRVQMRKNHSGCRTRTGRI